MARQIKVSKTGYKKNSPDKNASELMIPSGRITMQGVPHPVMGEDDLGNQMLMMPGSEYQFPGSSVHEVPLKQMGGYSSYPAKVSPELEAANQEAKRFAISRGLMIGENAHVDHVPQYVDESGKPYIPTSPVPNSKVSPYVPQGINSLEWDDTVGMPYFIDPHTGDMQYTKKEYFNLPRFNHRVQQEAKDAMPNAVAKMKKGGKWLQHATNPEHKGYCTPMTKSTCTGHRRAFAEMMKKNHGFHKKQQGGPAIKIQENANLPILNNLNLVLNKAAEGLRNHEAQRYNEQMIMLQNQPATYTPEGQFQYGNPQDYQIGGVIPQDVSYMATPTFDSPTLPSGPSHAPAGGGSSIPVPALSGEMTGYAQKADKYLQTKAPKSGITGEMLAQGANQAYSKYGQVVPVELALAQLQLEGFLAKATGNKPQRTRNPFNVGNTDSGATHTFGDVQTGINAYYDLIAHSYLKGKTSQDLLSNFTNSSGQRYATDPQYETKLKKIVSQENLKKGGKYKKGGTYDLSTSEIQKLRAQGYEFEEL